MKFAAGMFVGIFAAVLMGGMACAADTIAPGTEINIQNWRQYKPFMPDGMVALFAGSSYWKMPDDIRIDVGPTIVHPLPKGYLEATEKYASPVGLIELPDGGLTMRNYIAGAPFPTPSGPHKGWKMLADMWYRYVPHLIAATPENLLTDCTMDAYGNVSCEREVFIARVLKHITDPGQAMNNPYADEHDETRFSMIIEPEERRYASMLSIYYSDLSKLPSSYEFKPSERRVIPLSSAARCIQSGGSDMTEDDYRYGFAGTIPTFSATFIGSGKILALLDYQTPIGTFPANYDMPLGFPKPEWGKWELRDTYVLDVRKIPAHQFGYCYGKRIMYLDQQFYGPLWEDLYDRGMKLWKIAHLSPQAMAVPEIGAVNNSGSFSEQFWDVRNRHATFDSSFDNHGHTVMVNQQVPRQYDDYKKYSTVEGLSEIMR